MKIEAKDLYQKTMIEHGHNPLNFGIPDKYSYTEEGFNALCGDKVNIYINAIDQTIINFSFISTGCIICKASASIMTKELTNISLENAISSIDNVMTGIIKGNLQDDHFSKELITLNRINKFPSRLKCALLPWETAVKILKKIGKNVVR